MNKIVLDNGLTLYLFSDKSKNKTEATIYTKVGGLDNHFIYDGIEYNQVRGIAHFLEHYLIEKSIYGNISNIFQKEYIDTNGITNFQKTYYYISTVHDFKDNYIKLLNIVNNPKFDENEIEDIKKPIVSEINRRLDQPNYNYVSYIESIIYKYPISNITLGSIEDINNMTIDDIKIFYEAFYQPSNQMITICGNFDEDEIINITKKEYDSFKRDYKKIIRDDYKEELIFNEKEGTFVDNKMAEEVNVYYKLDVSNYTPFEKAKIDFYLCYYLKNNFGEHSEAYKSLLNKNLSLYSPSYSVSTCLGDNIYLITLNESTNNHAEVAQLLDNFIMNGKTDEKTFTNYKNNTIISFIGRYESIFGLYSNFEKNYFEYGYEDVITIDDIKNFNYEECVEIISKLDFSNKCVIKRIKGE